MSFQDQLFSHLQDNDLCMVKSEMFWDTERAVRRVVRAADEFFSPFPPNGAREELKSAVENARQFCAKAADSVLLEDANSWYSSAQLAEREG